LILKYVPEFAACLTVSMARDVSLNQVLAVVNVFATLNMCEFASVNSSYNFLLRIGIINLFHLVISETSQSSATGFTLSVLSCLLWNI